MCTETDAQDRLLRYDPTTFTYDDHGTLVARTDGANVTTYDYDELGNLRGVGRHGDRLIDGGGRRVAGFVDGVADKYWVYQDALNPVAQLDGTGAIEQLYVYGTRANVPDLIIEPGGATYAVVSDQVGSVRRVVDPSDGTVVQAIDYSPFGVIEAESASAGFDQPFRFAGGLWDADTELVRFGARDYDPRLGRWTAKDPIGFAAGDTNLFEYATSQPFNSLDMNGLWVVSLGAGGWGAVLAGSASLGGGIYFGTRDDGSFDSGFYAEYGRSKGVIHGVAGEISVSGSIDGSVDDFGGLSSGWNITTVWITKGVGYGQHRPVANDDYEVCPNAPVFHDVSVGRGIGGIFEIQAKKKTWLLSGFEIHDFLMAKRRQWGLPRNPTDLARRWNGWDGSGWGGL